MAVFWGCWKICPLKTREIANGTDKCEPSGVGLPVRRGSPDRLLTPPKRVTGGLLFPGAETTPESARDWRPSVGGFGGVGRRRETRADQAGAPNEGD